ncbi:MAG: hypothetical protein LBP37_07645 [Spirochaetaceae bacterium]|jgi:hypothetical protein|nr:hypothetical protein [Spirochaetaceae bacterium]
MSKIFVFTVFLFTVHFCLDAQDGKTVFKLQPLEADETSIEEARLLETIIYSYFSDFSDKRNFIILPPDGVASSDGIDPAYFERAENPDYIVSCSLYPENDSHVFELVVSDADSHEISRQTAKYKTTKDIALNMHTIVSAAFEWQEVAGAEPKAPDAGLINDENILGLWRGDMGIKLIRILPDGKAFAFFTSGVNMMLSYRIENNALNLSQISPNNENYYYPLPLPMAKVLAKEAEPIRWEFMLYENENLLKGNRIETTVEFEDYEKIVIRHNSIKKSEWNRLSK